MVVQVNEGHFGDVDLAGVRFGVLVAWPGPIHEGQGESQPFIDEDVTPEQLEAVATFDRIHEPIIAPVEFEADIEARIGHLSVPGVVEMSCGPIRNPVTGDPHRARIDIPDGFEYTIAEVADGKTQTGSDAEIELDWQAAHAHLINLHWTQHGVVH
jgi:hypothetical protein